MSTAVFCADCPSIMSFPAVGFSADVARLNEILRQDFSDIRKAETLGRQNETLQSLDEIVEECSRPGWDGYDALPITEDAYLEARRLIRCLPLISFIPMPDITPEPNGGIALEWSKGTRRIFVASIGGKNEITYAGLFGMNKTHGTEYFGDALPSVFLENLKRLYI
jgi:hypothetical protein